MPSTTSRTVSADFDSSTVMTPSLPTFSIASAIRLPIVLSLFDAIVATWAISFLSLVDLESFFSSSVTASTAASMPRFNPIGLAPAVTFFRPSRKIAWASTVAVVVPSPAMSEVLDATSFSIWAPMFSTGSASSISFATVTPSLVMVGEPNFLSMTTLRPLGPSVSLTASARWSIPFLSFARASVLKSNSFAAMVSSSQCLRESADLGQNVGGLDDDDLVVANGVWRPAILAVDHRVAGLDVHRDPLALVSDAAGPHSDDLALGGLLFGGVRDVKPASSAPGGDRGPASFPPSPQQGGQPAD